MCNEYYLFIIVKYLFFNNNTNNNINLKTKILLYIIN